MDERKENVVSLRPSEGTFDFRDAPPFAVAYLNTYYRQPPTADETAVFRFLAQEFAERAPGGRFLELGCGPTVHHVFPFAPHVSEIHMADYLDENLAQVRLWKANSPSAHDWSQYAALALRHEGRADTPAAVSEREQLARARITRVLACDLKQETPRDLVEHYDGVGCFYCAEEIGISPLEWRRVLRRVAAHVRRGGTLYMAALAGMDSYSVRDASGALVEYPCARIAEDDVTSALSELGFPRAEMKVQSSDIEHPDCGVTGTVVVAAVKRGSDS